MFFSGWILISSYRDTRGWHWQILPAGFLISRVMGDFQLLCYNFVHLYLSPNQVSDALTVLCLLTHKHQVLNFGHHWQLIPWWKNDWVKRHQCKEERAENKEGQSVTWERNEAKSRKRRLSSIKPSGCQGSEKTNITPPFSLSLRAQRI